MKKIWIFIIISLFLLPGCATNNSAEIDIPSYNQSTPSGMLDQLAWFPTGGPNGVKSVGSCNSSGCFIDYQNRQNQQLILRNFEPNQRVTLAFYRLMDRDSCGRTTAVYAAGYTVEVNRRGYLEINMTGPVNEVFLYAIYDANTGNVLIRSRFEKDPC